MWNYPHWNTSHGVKRFAPRYIAMKYFVLKKLMRVKHFTPCETFHSMWNFSLKKQCQPPCETFDSLWKPSSCEIVPTTVKFVVNIHFIRMSNSTEILNHYATFSFANLASFIKVQLQRVSNPRPLNSSEIFKLSHCHKHLCKAYVSMWSNEFNSDWRKQHLQWKLQRRFKSGHTLPCV